MQRCCLAIIQRTLRETDTPEEVHRKALWMPIMVVCLPMPLIFFLNFLGSSHLARASQIGHMINFFSLSVAVLWPLLKRSLSLKLVSSILCMLAVGTICTDITAAAEMYAFRAWTLIVLMMDLCLALNVPDAAQQFILGLTTAWTVVYAAEYGWTLGVYEVEHFTKSTGVPEICDCAGPPCDIGFAGMLVILPVMAILYGDYFATRGFATGLRAEQESMRASVEVAEQVAGSLAGFDLEAAGSAMTQAGDGLPPPLADSFRRLLRNLARYRPYLPQSCFEDDEHNAEGSEGQCGTDVEASTLSSQGPARRGSPPPPQHAACAGPSDGKSRGPLSSRTSFLEVRLRFEHRKSSIVSSASSTSAHSQRLSRRGDTQGAHPPRQGGHAQQYRRVTLLTSNRSGLLAAHRLDADMVSEWLAEQVELLASVIKGQGGVVDTISADHFSASFGAVKAQGSHHISATRAAVSLAAPGSGASALQALPRTGAVCSGRALCGDFGSSACQRFMVIGGVSAFLPAAERAAAAWGTGTLIDSDVHGDAEQFWSSRLRKLVKFPKLGPKPIGLWEVLEERMGAGPADEWMYELENAQANPWEPYNEVVRMWCGDGADGTLPAIAKALDAMADASDRHVAAALLAVRELVQTGVSPPVCDFSAAVFAGDAAPLALRGGAIA